MPVPVKTVTPMNLAMKILISEDKEADFIFTQYILTQISAAFEIVWAKSYHETIAAIESNTFDVCILDYRLGTHTALDVLYFTRNIDIKTAFIVFTALNDQGIDNTSMQQGASDYLYKDKLNGEVLERSIRYAVHRKTFEVQQAKYLVERELLLKEIEHRVKNNLEIISGLLSWEGNESKTPETKAVFRNAQGRIHTMMLIHEKLYQSPSSLDQIDFEEYINDLIKLLLESHGYDYRDVTIEIDMPHAFLELSQAVPCSLILNELISNSLTHAFPKRQLNKSFRLKLRKYGTKLHLFMKDNGEATIADLRNSNGFGLHLVKLLAEQIGAKVRYSCHKGFGMHFRFPDQSP